MEQTRSIEREFATGASAVVEIDTRSGSVALEGRDIADVRIHATLHVWSDVPAEADEAAQAVADAMLHTGERVVVRTPSLPKRDGWAAIFGHGSRVDYDIQVPRRTEVRVLSRSGRVQLLRVDGPVRVESMSGRVLVAEIGADVAVSSRSGSLQIEDIGAGVRVESRSGKVTVRNVTGPLEIDAHSGSVEANQVAGDIKLSAKSGSVVVEDAGARLYARTKAGSIRYRGKVLGDYDIEAIAGSVTLAVDPAHPFFLDAESMGGSVRSDLRARDTTTVPVQGGPKVRIRTKAGSIRLTRA